MEQLPEDGGVEEGEAAEGHQVVVEMEAPMDGGGDEGFGFGADGDSGRSGIDGGETRSGGGGGGGGAAAVAFFSRHLQRGGERGDKQARGDGQERCSSAASMSSTGADGPARRSPDTDLTLTLTYPNPNPKTLTTDY